MQQTFSTQWFRVYTNSDVTGVELAGAIKETTPLLNALHGQSYSDTQKDIWRDAQESKPTVRIPYLAIAPRLNGEVSDWPAAAKLPNVRTVRAVGSDRIKLSPIMQGRVSAERHAKSIDPLAL